MSAPDTNVKRQAKQHKAPLFGIAGALIFSGVAAVVIAVFFFGSDRENVNPVEPNAAPATTSDSDALPTPVPAPTGN